MYKYTFKTFNNIQYVTQVEYVVKYDETELGKTIFAYPAKYELKDDKKRLQLAFDGADFLVMPLEHSYDKKYKDCIAKRYHSYVLESDPLFMEWQFTQDEGDMVKWRNTVMDIKKRFPKP